MDAITPVHDSQIILRVIGDCFIPNGHSVAAYITKRFKERQCASGSTWRHVDQHLKDFYYHEFLKTYIWEPGHEIEFKETWNKYCQKLYKNLLYNWRRKGTRPIYVPDEIWDTWNSYWAKENWQHNSSVAQNNRNSELAGPSTGSTKHTAGSRSIVEHAIDLGTSLDRPQNCWEVFQSTHKKKDGNFVDARSKAIDDDMNARVAQASQPTIEGEELQTLSHDAINDIFYEVVGGRKKNSLYGLGSQAKIVYDRLMAPRLRGRPSSSSTEVQALRKENQELRDQVTELKQSIEDRVTAVEQSMEDQVRVAVDRQWREMLGRYSLMSPSAFPTPQTPHGFDSQETEDPNAIDK